jgi:hypothetical protein
VLNLSLRSEARSREELCVILAGQVRSEEQESGEVNGAFGKHLQQDRKRAHGFRSTGTALRFVFRQPKLVDAIGVERRAGPLAIDAPGVDLGEVSEELGGESVVTPGENLHLDVERVVGDGVELVALGAL